MKNVRAGDIVVIALVLLMAVAIFLFSLFLRSDDNMLVVSYGEKEFFYDLDVDCEFVVENNGHVLSVRIKDKKASVISSTCDGNDCVYMGEISHNNESVACLPARFFMKIVSSAEGGYDVVVG